MKKAAAPIPKHILHPFLFAGLFAMFGCVLLVFSRAATGNFGVAVESEVVVPTGLAMVADDPAAAGGSYVLFGGAGATFAPPTTIASDCSVDVATELNAWFASVPNGATVELPASGCYQIESALKIDSKTNWTINGNNALLKRTVYDNTAANMRLLHLANMQTLAVNNLKIDGGKDPAAGYAVATEDQHGVGIYGGSAIVLDGMDVRHVRGDFVYINRYQGTSATNIIVRNSVMTDSGRQGIAVIDGDTILVEKNNITNSNRYMIDLEPGGANVNDIKNVTFDQNTFSGGGIGFLSGEGAGGGISNLMISNNTLTGPMTILINPPAGFRRGPISIIGNTSTRGAARDLFLLHNIDGILIKDNNLMVKTNAAGNPVNSLVHLFDTTDTKIINNVTIDALHTTEPELSAVGYCESGNTPATGGVPACP